MVVVVFVVVVGVVGVVVVGVVIVGVVVVGVVTIAFGLIVIESLNAMIGLPPTLVSDPAGTVTFTVPEELKPFERLNFTV